MVPPVFSDRIDRVYSPVEPWLPGGRNLRTGILVKRNPRACRNPAGGTGLRKPATLRNWRDFVNGRL
jgi:hypothetical protein